MDYHNGYNDYSEGNNFHYNEGDFDMTFIHYPKREFPSIKRKNINHTRHYVDNVGNVYNSVTKVTGILAEEGLREWLDRVGEDVANHIMITASTNGTKVHGLCEDYLNNIDTNLNGDILALAHFLQLRPYLDKIQNIRGLEVQMFDKTLGLAGTVDCVADYDGVPSIIDFKTTGNHLKDEEYMIGYYLQSTAYSIMWESNTSQKIEQVVIPMSAKDGTSKAYIINRNDYVDKLQETIDTFNKRKVV